MELLVPVALPAHIPLRVMLDDITNGTSHHSVSVGTGKFWHGYEIMCKSLYHVLHLYTMRESGVVLVNPYNIYEPLRAHVAH